jgi:hypothetical protein
MSPVATREYHTSGFGGNNVVLQFSRSPGVCDGDTEFRVKTLPPFLGGRALPAGFVLVVHACYTFRQ